MIGADAIYIVIPLFAGEDLFSRITEAADPWAVRDDMQIVKETSMSSVAPQLGNI